VEVGGAVLLVGGYDGRTRFREVWWSEDRGTTWVDEAPALAVVVPGLQARVAALETENAAQNAALRDLRARFVVIEQQQAAIREATTLLPTVDAETGAEGVTPASLLRKRARVGPAEPSSAQRLVQAGGELVRVKRERDEAREEAERAVACVVCLDAPRAVLFMPCGHAVACAACSGAVADCPVCRQPVAQRVRAFFG